MGRRIDHDRERNVMEPRPENVQTALEETIRAELARRGLDGILAASQHNVFFASGSDIGTIRSIPRRLELCFFDVEGPPTFVVCNIEEPLVRATSSIRDVRPYVEFADDPLELLADAIRERGLESGALAIETEYLPHARVQALIRHLPDVSWHDAAPIWDELRAVKTPEEVALLRTAARATVGAIDDVVEAAEEGWTARQMANALQIALIEAGADEVVFNVLGVAEDSLMAHPFPGERQLQDGDIVKFDLGGLFKGYYSDVARTIGVGNVSRRRLDTYRRLAEVHFGVIERCVPGTRCCDLFEFCRAEFERLGLVFTMPHIGHSMGVELHEHPILNPQTTYELRPGMIINVEPIALDREDAAGYHIEDLVHVTDDGPDVLTAPWPPTEELPRIGSRLLATEGVA
jgi:Xaa-Pro dipeptidase